MVYASLRMPGYVHQGMPPYACPRRCTRVYMLPCVPAARFTVREVTAGVHNLDTAVASASGVVSASVLYPSQENIRGFGRKQA